MCVVCVCKLKDYIIHREIEDRLHEHYSQAELTIIDSSVGGNAGRWRYAPLYPYKDNNTLKTNITKNM